MFCQTRLLADGSNGSSGRRDRGGSPPPFPARRAPRAQRLEECFASAPEPRGAERAGAGRRARPRCSAPSTRGAPPPARRSTWRPGGVPHVQGGREGRKPLAARPQRLEVPRVNRPQRVKKPAVDRERERLARTARRTRGLGAPELGEVVSAGPAPGDEACPIRTG